jgi:hypothetical protein
MTKNEYKKLLKTWAKDVRIIGLTGVFAGHYGVVGDVVSIPDAQQSWPAAEPMITISWSKGRSGHGFMIYGMSVIHQYVRPLNALELMAEEVARG